MLVLVAATGKVLGCGLPVLAVRRSPLEALVVGIGMLPRVDICLFIATTGLVSGLFSEYYYSALIILSLATVLTGPIAVKATYCLLEKRCRLGPDTWPGVEK
jgi:Kef-type K+ transport system membrane component KefB